MGHSLRLAWIACAAISVAGVAGAAPVVDPESSYVLVTDFRNDLRWVDGLLVPVPRVQTRTFPISGSIDAAFGTLALGPGGAPAAFDLTNRCVAFFSYWYGDCDGKTELCAHFRIDETGTARSGRPARLR